jgi:oxygen-independent coproporphyrinogen-3 oxidase
MAKPLSLYIHWPFCVSKCPYCDFNSHVRDSVDHVRWRAALLAELRYYAALVPDRTLTSIFFGGGTPSLMHPETVAALIAEAKALWPTAPDLEITAEANPGSVDQAVFAGFAAAGVNRVSLGVQAFDSADLAFLGRQHDAAEARAAIALAKEYFPRFSFDLIYARPSQTLAAWQDELAEALSYGTTHLSLYQLTIEEGTKFAALHRQGAFVLPDADLAAALYTATGSALGAAGLLPYEVSNYAAPGQESRHNLTYWRYGDYVGVGPGAHGRLSVDSEQMTDDSRIGADLSPVICSLSTAKHALRNHRAPEEWLARVEAHGYGAHPPEMIAPRQRLEELLMMGLRLLEPIPFARVRAETGRDLAEWLDMQRVERLVVEGYLALSNIGIAATAEGRLRLQSVLGWMLG